jgi:hypothetical protein
MPEPGSRPGRAPGTGHAARERTPSRPALIVALLAGLGAWAVHFLLTYLLLTLRCRGADAAGAWIAVATAAAILVAGGAAAWATRWRRRDGHGPAEGFLLRSAILANAFAALLLALEATALAAVGRWCLD